MNIFHKYLQYGYFAKFLQAKAECRVGMVQIMQKNYGVSFDFKVWNSYYHPPKPVIFMFPQEITFVIVWEVALKTVRPQADRYYELTFRLYSKPKRRLLDEQCRELLIRSDQTYAHVPKEWGYQYKANWQPGDYEVELLLNGVNIVRSWFTIGPAPPPPPPKPAVEVLYQPVVRFYPLVSGKPLQETRYYYIRFPQQIIHKLFCELTVQNLHTQGDRTYAVTAQCYTVDEKLLWEDHHDRLIRAQEQEPLISWELQGPEGWSLGIYCVDILIDGLDFAWGAFAIKA